MFFVLYKRFLNSRIHLTKISSNDHGFNKGETLLNTRSNQISFSVISGFLAVILLFLIQNLIPGLVIMIFMFLLVALGSKSIERFPHAAIFWICLFTPWLVLERLLKTQQDKVSLLSVILVILAPAVVLEIGFYFLKRKRWSYFAVGSICFLSATFPLLLNQRIRESAPPLWTAPLLAMLIGGGCFLLGSILFDRFLKKSLKEKWDFLGKLLI